MIAIRELIDGIECKSINQKRQCSVTQPNSMQFLNINSCYYVLDFCTEVIGFGFPKSGNKSLFKCTLNKSKFGKIFSIVTQVVAH